MSLEQYTMFRGVERIGNADIPIIGDNINGQKGWMDFVNAVILNDNEEHEGELLLFRELNGRKNGRDKKFGLPGERLLSEELKHLQEYCLLKHLSVQLPGNDFCNGQLKYIVKKDIGDVVIVSRIYMLELCRPFKTPDKKAGETIWAGRDYGCNSSAINATTKYVMEALYCQGLMCGKHD